jgi:hypothetical protein
LPDVEVIGKSKFGLAGNQGANRYYLNNLCNRIRDKREKLFMRLPQKMAETLYYMNLLFGYKFIMGWMKWLELHPSAEMV